MRTTRQTPENLKHLVREKYSILASSTAACCGSGQAEEACSDVSEDYAALPGYEAGADLKLGCGLPTEYAGISLGDTVLDLGSGAGNDVFVARALVGEQGRVIGVDFAEAMIEKARANAAKLGAANVAFRLGDIEALPVSDGEVDVVISNCVLNLVPDKARAFAEMYRVLRPGGHFCVSDIVSRGTLPEAVRSAAELYAGCVAGAMDVQAYLALLRAAGFEDVRVVKERVIPVPEETLSAALAHEALEDFYARGQALLSVTVVGVRPADA